LTSWKDPALKRFITLELTLGLDGWLVSYCDGELKTGERVLVTLPFKVLPRWGLRRAIVDYAKRDGVYVKGMGLFDVIYTRTTPEKRQPWT
jgi:hypothetical protein